MITTGIIVGKYFDKDKVTMYKVSVSIFKSNLSDGIVDATCCSTPGQYEAYNQGDKVYISFVNNKLFCPVILGKIYSNIEEINDYKTSSYFVGNTLKVTNEANLPFNTKIGDIDFSNLKSMYLDLNNVASKLDKINNDIKDVSSSVTDISSKLKDKANIRGGNTFSGNQIIKGDSGDTPMYLQSKSVSSYVGFKDINGTTLGYYGINTNQKPVFYVNGDKELAFKEDVSSLLTPTLVGSAVSSDNQFSFHRTSDDVNGLYIFTYGNTMTLLSVYGLVGGTVYKTSGTFVYGTDGSVVTTTVNYGFTFNGEYFYVKSGNSQFKMVNGFTGYLYKIKLY